MKGIQPVTLTYSLTYEACAEIIEQISAFCTKQDVDRKEALRYMLSAEECLLFWHDHGCEGKSVQLRMGSRMRTPFILLEAEGAPLDPYQDEEESFGGYTTSVLTNLRLAPDYSYSGTHNQLLFRLRPKQPSQVVVLAVMIAIAALVGVLGLVLLPDDLREALLSGLVTPVYDTFFHVLSCLSGPMIFLSVAWGIYGIGDAATLGNVGKRLILRYLAMTFFVGALWVVSFPVFGVQVTGMSGQGSEMSALAELVLGIVPSTIVEPFSTGNSLQIVFLAVVLGIAMLYLENKVTAVARLVEQANNLMQFLMELVSRLIPFVILLVIVNLIWSGNLAVFASSWLVLVFFLAAVVATFAVLLLSVALKYRVGPLVLLRKGSDAFLIALSTASSAAAFSSTMTLTEKRYGVSPSLSSFGVPLGIVMHKPFTSIYYLLLLFYFAGVYHVQCSVVWMVLAVIVSAVIAVATPAIPGGGAVAYSVLFAQMGIPSEALALALTIDVLTDFVITSFSMASIPLSLIHAAYHLDMIDLETLRS